GASLRSSRRGRDGTARARAQGRTRLRICSLGLLRSSDVRPVWRPNDSRRRKLLPRPSGLERGQISPRLAWQQRSRRKSPSAQEAGERSVRALECQKPKGGSKGRAGIRLGTAPAANGAEAGLQVATPA